MSSGVAAAKQPDDEKAGAPAMSTASLSEPQPQYTSDGFLKIANEKAPAGALEVRGYDFNTAGGVDFRA
jgi:hypothetical protein